MPQPTPANERIKAALQGAALRTADMALHQGRRALAAVNARGGRLERATEQVVSRLRTFGERFIAKSHIPVPEVAQDAFGRMSEGLGQLEHVILSGDTSALKGQAKQTGKLHAQGKVDITPQANPSVVGKKNAGQRPRAHN